ncbi:virion protein [Bacillus phage AR9]|uniref:Virion protein n=1 Tax=Bacillus phage AR9 TaxID=1815509 RepID=A0A172JI78_BPPB1|nr:virion structural protein [Bacillus phage AR9]AMS01249.1 virion protein [Bacillus phage AR9]
MGRFIEEKDVIEKYINNFTSTTKDFSRFIEGSPNFVTYYSKDIMNSMEDQTLQGVMEVIGVESPIKFNKIENFPIYNMEQIDPNLEYDTENGLDTSVESTAIVLPNTLKPLPNDYFLVNYLNKDYLFRISNVETSSIDNKVFYRITYILSGDNLGILEERQLTEEYKVVYENIGKEAKSILKTTDFLLLGKIDDAFNILSKQYTKLFYNKFYNTFLFKNQLYDNMLMKFIQSNNLFINSKTFLKNIKIEPLLNESMDEFFAYDNSIYSAIEEKSTDNLENLNYTLEEINDSKSIFNLYKNKYNILHISYSESDSSDLLPLFISDFIKRIKTNEPYADDNYKINNFIINFLNNALVEEEIVNFITKEKIKETLDNYMIIPCILFILKEIKNTILNN